MKGRNLIAFLLVLLLAAGLLPRTAFAEEEMKTLPAAETEETESLSAVPTETESESQSDLIRTDRRMAIPINQTDLSARTEKTAE